MERKGQLWYINFWHKVFPLHVCPRCAARLEIVNDAYDVSFQVADLLGGLLWVLVGAVAAVISFTLLGEILAIVAVLLVIYPIALQGRRYWCDSCKRVIHRSHAIRTSHTGEPRIERLDAPKNKKTKSKPDDKSNPPDRKKTITSGER
jgi:hypothetical protein